VTAVSAPASPAAAAFDVEGALAALFARRGALPVEAPMLQPAEPFLDAAGDALRRRIFLTRGERGETLCLRPEFTIPVCLAHIAEAKTLPRAYGYRGLVFRQRSDEPAEFEQAGIEDFGDADTAGADARAIAGALEALAALGREPAGLDVLLGDQNLFEALLEALDLPAGWQRRLLRSFGDEARLQATLNALAAGGESPGPSRLDPALAALARPHARGQLEAAIAARMEAAGLPPFSGRSPAEVAERLIEKRLFAAAGLAPRALAVLQGFLGIDCPLGEAGAILRERADAAGLDLGRALTLFEARNAALDAAKVDLRAIRYRAAFGRSLDYYTGVVFEARARRSVLPLAGGGRYDRLLTLLGAPAPIPAVGFSLWLDRIGRIAGRGEAAR
jgi:ATP phosphoribosyltransferase regulatory subunit